MTKKTATKTTKQPYRKPQLEQVQLVLEEAVLAGCKASSTKVGQRATLGHQCTWPPDPCSTAGS